MPFLDAAVQYSTVTAVIVQFYVLKVKGKGHPCTGTEALYRPHGP